MEKKTYQEQIKDLKAQLKSSAEKIQLLESKIEFMSEPVDIEKMFNQLPIHDSVQLISKLTANLYGTIKDEQEQVRNKAIMLDNNLELLKTYSQHIVQDKLYAKNF